MGVGADRPRSWGGSTAFGADVGRIDPGRIDRYPCPRPRWGSLQLSPGPIAVFKGPTTKGRGKGTLDPTVEEGRGGRRARRDLGLRHPRTSFSIFSDDI